MERRLLSRNQVEGREDDNIETIRKRFKVFLESSLPVINYYDAKGKVRKIDAARPIEEVFESVKGIFAPKNEKVILVFALVLSSHILMLNEEDFHLREPNQRKELLWEWTAVAAFDEDEE
ncbi:hypothetical protein Fmac_028334 [Flemingia macrophylla]|uniref:adenylate kinase n=1 Tax=Flemingia macrophylla TaxID=520843 RepID=A0ABD1L769_9FABA